MTAVATPVEGGYARSDQVNEQGDGNSQSTQLTRPAQLDPVTRRIALPPYDIEAAVALESELGVSHVLAQILVRRGFHDADVVRELLEPRERYDAAAFSGMEDAVIRILTHVRDGGRIVVHGDYDVDGVCATAVLLRRCVRLAPTPASTSPAAATTATALPPRLWSGWQRAARHC